MRLEIPQSAGDATILRDAPRSGDTIISLPVDWKAIVQGDAEEFERLVRELTPPLSRLSFRVLGWRADQAELDDVLQDVFATVWAKRDRFRGDSSPHTWITTIALNVCRARIRRKRLWHRFLGLVRPAEEEPRPSALLDQWPRVVRAMHALPRAMHEVLVLHYLEEQPVEVIAGLLDVRKNTVEVRLHRARKRLQEALRQEPGEVDNAGVALRRSAPVV